MIVNEMTIKRLSKIAGFSQDPLLGKEYNDIIQKELKEREENSRFLLWIHKRLQYRYNEYPEYDYMRKLKRIALEMGGNDGSKEEI